MKEILQCVSNFVRLCRGCGRVANEHQACDVPIPWWRDMYPISYEQCQFIIIFTIDPFQHRPAYAMQLTTIVSETQ